MSQGTTVLVDVRGAVASLTLNRPDHACLRSLHLGRELPAAVGAGDGQEGMTASLEKRKPNFA